MKRFALTIIALLAITAVNAQSLVDGFMQGKGNGNLVVSYTYDTYTKFYNGDELVDKVPAHDHVTQSIVSLYGTYGLADWLDMIVNVPYISAKGHGMPDPFSNETETKGLQDISAFLKGRVVDSGPFSVIAALGFSAPLSDYEANSILSIGNHGSAFDGKALVQYKCDNGLFANAQAGYSIRGNDVPNATLLGVKVGYAGDPFYIDAFLTSQISDPSAPDINPPTVPFNETRVNFSTLGLSAYYSIASSWGITAGTATYLGGRNVGKATYVSGGVVLKW